MKRILPIIVFSQFFCTSLWFAGNAVMKEILLQLHLAPSYLVHLTSAVQFGFIAGTLVFAILTIPDRFSPTRVFFFCGILAALINACATIPGIDVNQLLTIRLLTVFFLAGIYPVGMKIASDHYQNGLGKSLGFLVGALVLGTSFPHLLKSVTSELPWKYVIYATSLLAVVGSVIVFVLVPDGPYRKRGQGVQLAAFLKGFINPDFRAAAFGYFGHMWEVYAFWVFIPVMLSGYNLRFPGSELNVPLLSFIIIASGSISCMLGGIFSVRFGPKFVAIIALTLSGICCVISPLFLSQPSGITLIIFLLAWGMAAPADSPMFSTLVAQNAPAESKGTALTMVNCIGFSITILSIQLINLLIGPQNETYIYMILGIGPILGLAALFSNHKGEKLTIGKESDDTPSLMSPII